MGRNNEDRSYQTLTEVLGKIAEVWQDLGEEA